MTKDYFFENCSIEASDYLKFELTFVHIEFRHNMNFAKGKIFSIETLEDKICKDWYTL